MKHIKTSKGYFTLVQVIVLAFFLLNYHFHDLAIMDVIKVYLYQLLGGFLVGYVIFNLLKIKSEDFTEVIVLSYALGGIWSIVVYLVFMIPGFGKALPYVTIGEIILCIVYLWRKRPGIDKYRLDTFSMTVCAVFLIFILTLSLITVSFVNPLPNENPAGTGYYVDWPFWAGNNISFTKGFPADCFRQVGKPFGYHYFSSILVAMASLCTGVDVNYITFYFSSIFAGILLVMTAYYFVTRITKNRILVVLSLIAVLFTDGSVTTLSWHSNICPFGFDYGYAYGMLSMAILVEILIHDRFQELMIPSVLCIAMTTGSKGPIGELVLAAYGVVALYYLITKRILRAILCGASWLLSFLVVCFVFIIPDWSGAAAAPRGLKYIGGLGINTVVTSSRWITEIYNSILEAYRIQGDRFAVKLLSVWLYLFRVDNVIITLALIGLILLVTDLFKKKSDPLLYALLVPTITGIILALYTTQLNGSQMYFLEGMFPMAAMSGMYVLNRIKKEGVAENIYKTAVLAVVFMLGLSVREYYEYTIPKVREGIAVVRDRYTADDYPYLHADNTDYEAFTWIKDNTDENAIVATDWFKDIYERDAHMVAGILSERYIWNEEQYVPDDEEAARRNGIVKSLKDDTEGAVRRLKEEGVGYILSHEPEVMEEYSARTGELTNVFHNDHFTVFEIE